MLRVTGGELRGRRLRVPKGGWVRPTSDRVREALFARLELAGGERVLDLYAGSGALGIEALSRGARRAVFVERRRFATTVIEQNLTELGLQDRRRLVCGEAVAALHRLEHARECFDLVFLDPPYAGYELERSLTVLSRSAVLASGAIVVLESPRQKLVADREGFSVLDVRRYGDTLITRLLRTE